MKKDGRILGVLIFGSRVRDRAHERSDVDICVVAPGAKP
ncbi:MAG TPA: nucleotidyltransferase domain-containing protein [Hadesarchaea archaeon]|nr:nucleotidyltransferase domain-containing protein [Hadesarchaea archaeon]